MWIQYCYFILLNYITSLLPYGIGIHYIKCSTNCGPIKSFTFHWGQRTTFDARLVGRVQIRFIQVGFVQLFEPSIKLTSPYVVLKWSMYRFLQNHRKLLSNVTCGVKVVTLCYVVVRYCTTRTCCLLPAVVSNGILYVLPLLYVACMQPLPCGRDIFFAHEKRISWAPRLMSSVDTCIGLRIYA